MPSQNEKCQTLERLLNVFLVSHISETREDSDGCPLYLQLQVLPNSSYLTNRVFFNGRHLLLLQMYFDIRCPAPDLSTLDGRQSLSHLICVNTTVPCSGMVLKLCLRPSEKVVLRTLHVCAGTVCRWRCSSHGQTSKCCVLYCAPDDFWGASDDGRCFRLHNPWMC